MRPISPSVTVKTVADGVLWLMIFSLGAGGSAEPGERGKVLATFLPIAAAFYVLGVWMRDRWRPRGRPMSAGRLSRAQRWVLQLVVLWVAIIVLVLLASDLQHRTLILAIALPSSAALSALSEWSEHRGRPAPAVPR